MTERRKLPARRNGFTFDLRHSGRTFPVTIGCYEDWSIGEVFIGVHKLGGSDADRQARDIAVLISLALQWGVPLETMSAATIKTESGAPDSLAGIVLAELIEWQSKLKRQGAADAQQTDG